MRDIITEVVVDMQRGPDPKLKGGWSRGCPVERQERALIELWVAFVEKVEALYRQDVGKLESLVQEQAVTLSKAHKEIAKMKGDLGEVTQQKTRNAINGHVDRLGERLPTAEATRLLAETDAA